jgi:hypothetical protein
MKFSGHHFGSTGNNTPGRATNSAFAAPGSDSRRGEGLLRSARLFARAAAEFLVQRTFGIDADSCRALVRYTIGGPVFTPFVFTPVPSERLSIRRPKTKLAPPFITPREEGGAIFFQQT